jgi:NADH-quinone oxidoreductase subunit G
MGATLGLPGFDFTELEELRLMMRGALVAKSAAPRSGPIAANPQPSALSPQPSLVRISTVPIYRSDAVVRRAKSLQDHPLTGSAAVGLNPEDALALGLAHGAQARVSGGEADAVLPVVITRAVPRGAAWVEATWSETRALPPTGAPLTVTRA